MPVIGYLSGASAETTRGLLSAFHRALADTGYVEGRNVTIEYRWAENHYDRLPALAAELVRRQVAVIAVGGSTPGAHAVKAATQTIPVVFLVGPDPVAGGLVASYNRPGGNLTGVRVLSGEVIDACDVLSQLQRVMDNRRFLLTGECEPLPAGNRVRICASRGPYVCIYPGRHDHGVQMDTRESVVEIVPRMRRPSRREAEEDWGR